MGNHCSFEIKPDGRERVHRNRSWFLHSKHHSKIGKGKPKKYSTDYVSLNSFDSSSPKTPFEPSNP